MRFSTAFLVSALAALASAQNMFTMASIPSSIAAGSTFNITWQPTTQGSVSLLLVQASSAGSTLVHPVSTIAANITNSGAFAWIPSSLTPKGSGYAIEIVDDANPFVTNYSGQFAIDSTAGPSSSASASGASVSGTTASATGSATGSASASSTTGSTTGSASASKAPSSTGSTATTPGSTTLSTVVSSSATSSAASSASSSTASSSTSSATATAKNAAARAETGRSGLGLLAALGVAVLFW